MLKAIIDRILRGRHYWRTVSFDEIAELYVSRLITVFAINTINLFAAVYLHKLGYSIVFIALFYAAIYTFKIPFAFFAAKYAAYFGPKHGILLANILRIPSLVAFALVPVAGPYAVLAIALFGLFQQMSGCLYDICYYVNFSKVRSIEHTGREIGTMQQLEKIARVISPLVGGLIASTWSMEATIIATAILFAIGALPLFQTLEPVATRVPVRIAGFPWRPTMPSLASSVTVGVDFVASSIAWTLFIATVVFANTGENVYNVLGGLASLGVFVSILAAWIYGRLIDRRQGDVLLVSGVLANVVLHIIRPFVATPLGVVLTNVVNESATSAYTMPYMRVQFDVADSSGHRTAYFMFYEMIVSMAAALASVLLAMTSLWLGATVGFMVFFFVIALVEPIMLLSMRSAR